MIQFSLVIQSCIVAFASSTAEVLRAIKGDYVDRFQVEGALLAVTTSGLIECQALCMSNAECISFFYNRIERRCILHADAFVYSQPTETGAGWNFSMTSDVTGRCPTTNNFMYQRELDLCFNLNPPQTIDFILFKSICQQYGGELVRIETEKRQKFFEMILANEATGVVCIQGTDSIVPGVWTFDDKTVMNYTNWDPDYGQPNGGQGYLAMIYGFKWHDLVSARTYSCLPICEKRG